VVLALRREPSGRLLLRWLVAMTLGAPMLVALVYLVAVRTLRGRRLDGASLEGAELSRSRAAEYVEGVLDVVSVLSVLVAVLVVVAIALLRGRRRLAVAAVALMLGANVTTQLLKAVLERPDVGLRESTPATLNSLPSGHSTVALSVAVALVLVSPSALRPVVAVLGTGYATATGLASLTAGWHRPSDAVAAFLVVGGWTGLVGTALVATTRPDTSVDRVPEMHRRTSRRLAVAAAYLLAFGALVAAVLLATGLTREGTAGLVPAYLAGGGAIAGTAAGVVAALLAVVHQLASGADGDPATSDPSSGA